MGEFNSRSVTVQCTEVASFLFSSLFGFGSKPVDQGLIRAGSLETMVAKAEQIVTKPREPNGIGIDLDAIGPRDAQGFTVLAVEGVSASGLAAVRRGYVGEEQCVAVAITEYSLRQEVPERTANPVIELLVAAAALPAWAAPGCRQHRAA